MKNVKRLCLFLGFSLTAGAVWAACPEPNAQRIDEIAKMLPAAPGFAELNVTNRVFWDKARKDSGADYAIRMGEKYLDMVVQMPDDFLYEKVYGWNGVSARNSTAVRQLALAECLENKGRFLPKLIEFIRAKCDQTTWMNPYHDRPNFGNFRGTYRTTDLETAEQVQDMAIALDSLRGTLPAEVEALAMAALWKHCYSNYLAKSVAPNAPELKGRNAWFFGDANWNVACHGWCVAAAVRTIPDAHTRARFIEAAERAYPYYLNGFSSDGYCGEGMDYWNFGFGMFLHLAWTVRAATSGQVDFFAHPMARKDFLYAFESMQTDTVTLRFGDGTAGSPSTGNLFLGGLVWPDLMTPAARANGANLNSPGGHPYRTLPMIMGRLNLGGSQSYQRPVRSYFPAAQVLVCRPAKPMKSSLSACIRGGHNACSHNHNDVGQYAIAVGDVPVVEDPSGAAYTLETFTSKRYNSPILSSYSHAVPRPDQTLQRDGRQYASKIVGHGFSDHRDWIELDLAGCYRMTNAVQLTKLTRRLDYDRAADVVTVEDSVAFTKPAAFETPISTFGRVVAGPTPDAFVIMRANGSDEVRLLFTVDTHGAKWHVSEEVIANPRRESPRRWAVVLDEPVKEAKVTIRYCVDTDDVIGPNDRVVFLGDSITHGGAYGEFVNLFYATRYPGSNRWFSNSGWSGVRLPQGIASVDEDIAAKDPTVVTVFYGMNDSGSQQQWPRDMTNYTEKASKTLKEYETNYTNLLSLIAAKAKAPRIVYVTPSPYDQTCDDHGQTVSTRKNDVMGLMSDWVKARAAAEGAPCVDLYGPLMAINTREQAKNPAFSVLRQGKDQTDSRLDRVHPGAFGHMLFLDAFVRAFHAPGTVGEIRKSVYKQNTCEIRCLERALPFPADANMARSYAYSSFVKDFNREILRMENLVPGTYRVTVDGKEIGQWTADQLGNGVNIATNAATPQYQQALKVKGLNARLWGCERDLRLFLTRRRWLRMHYKVDPDDLAAVETLRETIKDKKPLAYDYNTFGEYVKKWPDREKVIAEAARLREEIKKAAKPVPHTFKAVPANAAN